MTSKEEYFNRRLIKLLSYMDRYGIEQTIINKPEHVYYFTAFNPILNSSPVQFIVKKDGNHFLLVPALRKNHALEDTVLSTDNVMMYGNWGSNKSGFGTIYELMNYLIEDQSQKLAIELDYVRLKDYQVLQSYFPQSEFVDISSYISKVTQVKDNYEIEAIRKSASIVDKGIETFIDYVSNGYTDAEASTQAQYRMRQLWHQEYNQEQIAGFGNEHGGIYDSFNVWSLTNQRIAYGADEPKHTVLSDGDHGLPMAWAKINGYHAENERSILKGKNPYIVEKAYDTMLEARQIVFKHLKAGITFSELFNQAMTIYKRNGFSNRIPGRIGHGIGLFAHEHLSIDQKNTSIIKPGTVLTIEPSIMDSEWGGVHHSDTIVVLENGFEFLTKLERNKIRI